MRTLLSLLALCLFAGAAHAQCYKEIRKPQKPRDVVRLAWKATGRTWQVLLSWQTASVSDEGDEVANVVLAVRDNLKKPKIGDFRVYDMTPNRCDLPIDPQVSTVKLMGRDFLLVTVPDGGDHGTALVARMYSIDEKGHLTQVFYSVQRGHMLRGPECRSLLRSLIRPANEDGSRIAWVYEYPNVEWVEKKADCAKAKIETQSYAYQWINGCFAIVDRAAGGSERLLTRWDDETCVSGKGMVPKPEKHAASPKAAAPSKEVRRP